MTLTQTLRMTAVLVYVGAGAGIWAAPWALAGLFGSAFADAAGITRLLLVAVAFSSLRQAIIGLLQGFREARVAFLAELTACCVFVVMCLIAVVTNSGPEGVATAAVLSNACALTVCSRYLSSMHGISSREWLLPRWATFREAAALARRSMQ